MVRNIIFGIYLIITLFFTACIQKYDSENDFEIEIIKNGTAVKINYYIGGKTEVNIPPFIQNLPVSIIGDTAFRVQEKLTNINIPNTVTRIENAAFIGNKLEVLNIPNGVKYIGSVAFSSNLLTNINIPESVTHIDNAAFQNNKLINVIIPNSTKYIGRNAFANNNIVNITIGSDVIFDYNIPEGRTIFSENVFEYDFDHYYLINGRKAGSYIYSNNQWNLINNENVQITNVNNQSTKEKTGNIIANTIWETILDTGDHQKIEFGENSFRWSGEPWTSSLGTRMPGRNEIGTYRIQGEMIFLDITGFIYTGILIGNTLSISATGIVGWEFKKIN